jgi:hypothetical protein
MQTARWNHNQGVPWEDEDDVGVVEEVQWELPSCLAKKNINFIQAFNYLGVASHCICYYDLFGGAFNCNSFLFPYSPFYITKCFGLYMQYIDCIA